MTTTTEGNQTVKWRTYKPNSWFCYKCKKYYRIGRRCKHLIELNETTKTTISVSKELWKQFQIKVIKEYGLRKNNDVIEELIRSYTYQ